ncbi:MAG: D-alanyl-D-alanine carboxypeptidase/D-alanyl-D-alanine-endopeptidase [Gemmatimonadaceae bacterium]|nr:D-alanyl-D-alanine carboxypeptidase/D-alanyl-D-alanine-endopeptidase [Gemmatimonadaceae bacterium]
MAPTMTPVVMPAAVVPSPTVREVLRGIADSVLASPMWRNARWGMLVVDPVRGDTLLSHDADRLFMPASNQKLLTGAIALQVLGPTYEWRTPVVLRGRKQGKTFVGDVLVYGSGDPSISHALRGGDASIAFAQVSSALKERGITRITGRILPAGDAFPGATTGFGWAWDDFDAGYSAAIDELMYNEGELYVQVRAATRVGKPVLVQTLPTRSYPEVVVRATTRDTVVPVGAPRPARLEIAYDSIGQRLVVDGTLALGDSARVTVAYRHPADAFVAALRERLADSGIVVSSPSRPAAKMQGATPAEAISPKAGDDTLVVIMSAPFADVLRRMQKPSQNQIAELLFRTSALVGTGFGRADSAQVLGARTLALWGITSQDVAYRDGSGLSRHDYLTPRAVVRVLDAMRKSPWGAMFYETLPVAGVDGTIANRMRGTPAAGNVHAKTGTLDKARSLSGYVTTADGQPLLFSMLANNFSVPTREVERVQDLVATYLASVNLGGAPQR